VRKVKLDKTIWVMGEEFHEHLCDNCEEEVDGIGYVYWEKHDFTLCSACILQLSGKI